MKTLTLAALAMLSVAAPAMAQNFTSQRFGNQTYFYGSDGTTGNSQTFGNQTYTHFNSPNGQMTSCTQQRIGNQVYTNCQ